MTKRSWNPSYDSARKAKGPYSAAAQERDKHKRSIKEARQKLKEEKAEAKAKSKGYRAGVAYDLKYHSAADQRRKR